MRPVLQWDGNEIRKAGRARGAKEAFRRVLAASEEAVPRGSRIRLGLIASSPGLPLEEAEREMNARYDVLETLRGDFTGVIGAHTGPGTWGVVVQHVAGDDPLG
jgi:fatty acid-binding protein DegV